MAAISPLPVETDSIYPYSDENQTEEKEHLSRGKQKCLIKE